MQESNSDMSFSKKDFSKNDTGASASSIPMSVQGSSSSLTPSNNTMRRRNPANSNAGGRGGSRNNGNRNRNLNGYSKRNSKFNDYKSKEQNHKPDLVDDLFEKNLIKSSKKGIDISHLLDFRLPEHERHEPSQYERRRNNKYKNSRTVKLNLTGRNYVNVNYRFIVDPRGDYKPQMLDANLPIDDSMIIRVVVNKNDHQCPICLGDEFVAPRMTRCGHIFCYPCLLRLFSSLSEEDAKKGKAKCPLCSDEIREKHTLIPVLINNVNENSEKPIINQFVDLQLMYRPANKILPQPFYLFLKNKEWQGNIPWVDSNSTPQNFISTTAYAKYARIMKCNLNFILQCFKDEMESIKNQQAIDKAMYYDEGSHYTLAIMRIKSQMDAMTETFMSPDSSEFSLNDTIDSLDINSFDLNELTLKQTIYQPHLEQKGYFYYQHFTQSNIKYILSSLDIHILKVMYGDYSKFPLVLRAKLENINYDNNIVTLDLIHKMKYMGHLPVGTELGYLEIDWLNNYEGAPYVPPEILSQFKKKLKERSRLVKNKKLKEDRNKKNFEKELELKTLQFYSSENNISLEDYGYRLKLENGFNHIDNDNSTLFNYPSVDDALGSASTEAQTAPTTTTIWGTVIPRAEDDEPEPQESYEDVELMIKQAKEQQKKGGKKKKGKRIVLSLN